MILLLNRQLSWLKGLLMKVNQWEKRLLFKINKSILRFQGIFHLNLNLKRPTDQKKWTF